jgi:hypothetical protein
MRVRISAIVALVMTSGSVANAAFNLYWPDDTVMYIPDEVIFVIGVVALVVCLALICALIEEATSSSSSIAQMDLDLPEEVSEPESVEYYDEVTARTRALKDKLDADTELAESYIKAARARAALEDLEVRRDSGTRRGKTASR